MKTVYIDSDFKCHVNNDGTMIPVEDEFFNDKCDTFIEGYCYEILEDGRAIYPWKDFDELDSAQREYERQLLATYEEALKTVGVKL